MEKLQRFGGAMMPPVMLMPFSGIMIGLATIFMSQDIMGLLASDTTLWYKIWSMLYDGGYAIFNQLPLLFAISLPLGLTNKASGKAAMESFVIFITINYFIQSLLTSFGADVFGVLSERCGMSVSQVCRRVNSLIARGLVEATAPATSRNRAYRLV